MKSKIYRPPITISRDEFLVGGSDVSFRNTIYALAVTRRRHATPDRSKDFEQRAAALGEKRTVLGAGGTACVSEGRERLSALALRIVADS